MSTEQQTKIKTMVVLGSTRAGRMGDRVAKFLVDQIKASTTGAHEIDFVDVAELKLGLMDQAVGWMDPSTVPQQLQDLAKRVADADAYILISPEYNHSAGPALVNFLNHFPPSSYAFKPSAIATYSVGPFGGVRAAMQMRALTGELGCIAVPTLFAVPVVQNSLDEAGKPVGDNGQLLVQLAAKVLSQVEWIAEAYKVQRAKKSAPA